MFFKILSIFLTLCTVGYGIPLEDPSENMAKFFDSRIVGGVDAPDGYAPHMAVLLFGVEFVYLACGASIVSTKLLLTAAHCVDIYVIWGELMPSFHALVGTNVLNVNRGNEGQRVDFEDFHIHPEWDWGLIKNDIAFLMIKDFLSFTKNVQPIQLNLDEVVGVESCYATGFGYTAGFILPSRKQLIYLETMDHEDCVKAINNHVGPSGTAVVDKRIEMCTFHSFGHGMCNGDSGGALVMIKNLKQVGVVSWGFACAVGAPDVFVRLSGFKDYIIDQMEKHR